MRWYLRRLWGLLSSGDGIEEPSVLEPTIGSMPQPELIQRLEALSPQITEILRLSGTAGASVGVLHMDEVVYTANYGYRDIEAKIPPNEDTLYYIASLSKFMTAAGLGTLVEAGELEWEDQVSKALPDFQHCNQDIRNRLTIVDILSHRTGLAQKMFAWMGEHSRPQVIGADFTKTTTYLEPKFEIGSTFISNNWFYGIAAQIIERFSKKSFSDYIESTFFAALKMHRTRVHSSPDDMDNFAEAYMYNGETPHHVHKPPIEAGATMEGAVGVKSSVHDLLIYYREFLRARKDQFARDSTSTPNSPFKQVQELLRPQIVMDGLPSAFDETTYSLGWAQAKLPSALGALGGNVDVVKEMPRIGDGLQDKHTVLYHAGSLVGYLSSIILLPDTNSAIIVLANTLPNQDSPDWIGQALLEALLDVPHVSDFVSLAKEAAATDETFFPKMHNALLEERIQGTSVRHTESYVGRFENQVGTFVLDIYLSDGELCLSLNGYRPEKHKLSHYHYDTFSFEMTYEDCLRREMWPKTFKPYYLLEFGTDTHGNVTCITWRPDWAVAEGEIFTRRRHPQSINGEGRQRDKVEL